MRQSTLLPSGTLSVFTQTESDYDVESEEEAKLLYYLNSFANYVEDKQNNDATGYVKKFITIIDMVGKETTKAGEDNISEQISRDINTAQSVRGLGDRIFSTGVNPGRVVVFMQSERVLMKNYGREIFNNSAFPVWKKNIMPTIINDFGDGGLDAWIDNAHKAFEIEKKDDIDYVFRAAGVLWVGMLCIAALIKSRS